MTDEDRGWRGLGCALVLLVIALILLCAGLVLIRVIPLHYVGPPSPTVPRHLARI